MCQALREHQAKITMQIEGYAAGTTYAAWNAPTVYAVAVARDAGYAGPMRELPKELAQQIYARDYIERPNFHRVIAMSPAVGEKLVDAGVNAGPGRSARWFQTSLNHLSRGGADFPLVSNERQPEVSFPGRKSAEVDLGDADPLGKPSRS